MTVTKQIRLGFDPHSRIIQNGTLATHALTMAQPRTGKGAAQIIPTLRDTWTGNVLCIDPKGEALTESAEWRENLGQEVIAIDPVPNRATGKFCSPEKYRKRFNPLDLVGNDDSAVMDIHMLADALVIPGSGSKDDNFFDDTARILVAGTIAYILETAPPEERHLGQIPGLLRVMNDPKQRDGLFKEMNACIQFGGLAQEAVAYMRREGGKSDSIYTTAAKNFKWLADANMVRALSASDFDLNDLRSKPMSLFLVLPFSALDFHRVFLRLFVRCCLSVMELGEVSKGSSTNRHTLFVLDEFHKLGKISSVVSASGAMPGYHLHLWPICHGLGQLSDLYGKEGAEILLGASDYVCMFGIGNDQTTAEYASRRIGNLTSAEVSADLDLLAFQREESEKVRHASDSWLDPYYWQKLDRAGAGFFYDGDPVVQDQRLLAQMGVVRSRIGRPRVSPEQVIALTARHEGQAVAGSMIVCRSSGGYQILGLLPYFWEDRSQPLARKPKEIGEELIANMQQAYELWRDAPDAEKRYRKRAYKVSIREVDLFHNEWRRQNLIIAGRPEWLRWLNLNQYRPYLPYWV